MLTQQDLEQIDKIVQKRVEEIVDKKLAPIKRDIRKIMSEIRIIKKVTTDEYLDLLRRTERIEEHLRLN